MRKLLTLCAVFAVFSSLALAQSFSGKLLDARCFDRHHSTKGCTARARTQRFVLAGDDGKIYRMTPGSNGGLYLAMQSRDDRGQRVFPPPPGPVFVRIKGTVSDSGRIRTQQVDMR
jgi:hypothetical protein